MRIAFFDIETHSSDYLFDMASEEFFRLGGWKWSDEDEVHLTSDLEELKAVLRSADLIVGHNIMAFDLRAVFGLRSDEPLEMAMRRKVVDTWVHAVMVNPAPAKYLNRHGKEASAESPAQMMKWYSLDEQAFQLGVAGKTADLRELALEFGDPELTGKARLNDGFGKIPVTDERFRDYLIGDVLATEAVYHALLKKERFNDYHWREQEIAARAAVISSNGFRVDIPKAQARVDVLAERRDEILADLVDRYDFPTEGEAPWSTTEGKRAIMAALKDAGITPEAPCQKPGHEGRCSTSRCGASPGTVDWPKTPVWDKRAEEEQKRWHKALDLLDEAEDLHDFSEEEEITRYDSKILRLCDEALDLLANPLPPAYGLSLSGDHLVSITKGTKAEDLGQALAELKGQRSLAQLALESVHSDGFAHPEITMLQRSGRWSTTKPGLTVWTSRGENAVEKEYFIPDAEDEVLIAVDYSNADARVVAAYSGDKKFAERFEPGADGHMINAIAAWGRDVVDTDPDEYRQKAKRLGHGWNYGGQYRTLAKQAGLPLEDSKQFCDGMNSTYERLIKWQNHVRSQAQKGYVVNWWGRKMIVEKGREFTQAPALMGQSGTREIMCDALLRMPVWMLRRVKAQIHDELIFSVPRKTVKKWTEEIVKVMTTTFDPGRGGQPIEFPVSAGKPADNWFRATH